jgi:hypothetical protein
MTKKEKKKDKQQQKESEQQPQQERQKQQQQQLPEPLETQRHYVLCGPDQNSHVSTLQQQQHYELPAAAAGTR